MIRVTASVLTRDVKFFEVLPTLLHLCGAAFSFMGNPKPIECAQCIQSMANAKGELLTRIACANCQYAQESLESDRLERERSSRRWLVSRCPECGKWCWTRTSLAIHRELHRAA